MILTFAVASLVAWLLLRALFGIRGGTSKVWKTDVNENPPPE